MSRSGHLPRCIVLGLSFFVIAGRAAVAQTTTGNIEGAVRPPTTAHATFRTCFSSAFLRAPDMSPLTENVPKPRAPLKTPPQSLTKSWLTRRE